MLSLFSYDFMQRALAAGLVVGVLAPAIGMFLVAKRYSLLADTLSHVSLVGVALGALLGIHPLVGALVISSLAGVGIEELRLRKQLYGESVLALVLSGSLALAIVLFGFVRGAPLNILSILFGSITTVTVSDLWVMTIFGVLAFVVLMGGFKQFFLAAYDEELATASGVRTRLLSLLLVLMASIVVSLSLQIVGTLLVGALMVIPVMTATQFKRGFFQTFLLSIVCSLASVLLGLIASFYLNLPSGGSIVLVALTGFGLSLLAPKRGVKTVVQKMPQTL